MRDEAEPTATDPGRAETTSEGGLRLWRALATLVGAHVEQAQEEATADARRLLVGALLGVFAVLAALFALGLLHVLAALTLREVWRWSWREALAALAATDAVGALVLALAARARWQGPVLVRTRSLVRRTVGSLTEP